MSINYSSIFFRPFHSLALLIRAYDILQLKTKIVYTQQKFQLYSSKIIKYKYKRFIDYQSKLRHLLKVRVGLYMQMQNEKTIVCLLKKKSDKLQI